MLRSEKLVAADVRIIDIAVPITLPMMVQRTASRVKRLAKNIPAPRRQNGTTTIMSAERTRPVRKKPNMNCDAIFKIFR